MVARKLFSKKDGIQSQSRLENSKQDKLKIEAFRSKLNEMLKDEKNLQKAVRAIEQMINEGKE